MKRTAISISIVFFILCSAFSQKETKIETIQKGAVHIETIDGNDFIGKIITEDATTVKLSTDKFGEITIRKSEIKKRDQLSDGSIVGNEYWYANPNSTRYLFAPNAYALKKGEGYYQNTWVFMNQVSYGFTDKFTVGLGTVPLFIFGNSLARYSPFWVTPKYTFGGQQMNRNVAAGVFYFFFPFAGREENGPTSAGIVYSTGTIGNRNNNLSFGLGYGFGRYTEAGVVKTSFARYPTFNLSGMYRVAKRSYIVSENWFLTTGEYSAGFITGAYRYSGKSVSIDIGLVAIASEEYTGVISPWLGVLIPFTVKGARR